MLHQRKYINIKTRSSSKLKPIYNYFKIRSKKNTKCPFTKTPINRPSVFSISISVLRKSHDFRTVDLVPLRQINADLRSTKEVLARIHEIVLM